VTVHSRTLSAEQVQREHEMLASTLIDDAISSAPAFLQGVLRERHEAQPMPSPDAVGRALMSLLREVNVSVAPKLWTALYSRDMDELATLLAELKPHQLAICTRWRHREPNSEEPLATDEFTPPFGDTLLHMAAFVGNAPLVEQLLGSGARAARVGVVSGCSALHAAAAADQADICRMLVSARARVDAASAGKWYTPLHMACIKGLESVALALVEMGADPYDAADGVESPMALLRGKKTEQSRALWVMLDGMSQKAIETDEGTPLQDGEKKVVEDGAGDSVVEFPDGAEPDGAMDDDEEEDDEQEQDDATKPKRLMPRRTVSEEDERKADLLFGKVQASEGSGDSSGGEDTSGDEDEDEDGEDDEGDDSEGEGSSARSGSEYESE